MKERGDVLVRIRYGVTERYHSNSKCNASWVCVGGGGAVKVPHLKPRQTYHVAKYIIPTLDHRAVWCHCGSTDGAVAIVYVPQHVVSPTIIPILLTSCRVVLLIVVRFVEDTYLYNVNIMSIVCRHSTGRMHLVGQQQQHRAK